MFTEVIKGYKSIVENIDGLIKASGYRTNYVYEQMGMDKASFYYKKKQKKFTIEEIENLVNIIKADDLEDKVLLEMSLEAEKEGEIMTWEETKKLL